MSAEQLEALPDCLKLHGLLPDTAFSAMTADEARGFMGTMQYMLVDVLKHRNALIGAATPQPQWAPEER